MGQVIEILTLINWLHFTLIALCGLGFYLFNELEDKSTRNGWEKNTNFLNLNESWYNKWKLDIYGKPLPYFVKRWYYFGINPKYEERFFLSSTMLVFVTDGEHLFQFLKKRFIEAGILIISWQMCLAWIIGVAIMSIIKEKFLKSID